MTKESTLQPFEKGDVFAGVTLLNNPDDDHAGDGRIIQYDADLNEKGVLWTDGTTHLVGGLKFGPDGNLWAFDSQAYKVIRVSPEGRELPEIKFADKSFSNVCFLPDGNLILGEHLVGHEIKLPPDRPLGTTLPFMPGTERFGDGHAYKFSLDGELLQEFNTETHGGMPGFLGCTSTTLLPDGKTLVYCSELGNRSFRYDLEANQQLPDLITYTPDSGDMVISTTLQADGTLLHIKANFQKGFALQTLNLDGSEIRSYEMPPPPGWAGIGTSIEANTAFIGNFFNGNLIKFDLEKGAALATAETGVARALAGIAQYPG
ncbi:MAG: WD40 repeat domain-containing protein [Gammaproteobacteria bacterium]|nr:WD40 repeat domain-containing protein [Gammaproteobacteria bacterium]